MSEQNVDWKGYKGEINSIVTSDRSFSGGFFEMRKEETETA